MRVCVPPSRRFTPGPIATRLVVTGLVASGLAVALAGCPRPVEPPPPPATTTATTTASASSPPGVDDHGRKLPLPPVAAEPAAAAAPRVTSPALDELDTGITSYFANHVGQRVYVQIDKPLYKPGESLWFRLWDLAVKDLGARGDGGALVELVSPRGSVVERKLVPITAGFATNDFVLASELAGGEYKLRAYSVDRSVMAERPVVVSSYEPPRMKKKLEFLRKAYGPGDVVSATFELKRPTGEPMKKHPVTALLRLDGEELPRVATTTDDAGSVVVKVPLPGTIATGDGLLTILVEDGGITESIGKAVPIVMKRMALSFFPEGGKLVTGLQSRVYFAAKTPLGKPADVAGDVVDDQGQVAAHFESYKDGLGRFTFIPAIGRTYQARITKPEGIIDAVQLPVADTDGCVLRTYDDVDGAIDAVRAAVTCTTNQTVLVSAVQREQLLDKAAVAVVAGKPSIVALAPATDATKNAMGVARVTVFNEKKEPLAERLVFRNRRARLDVNVKAHKQHYAPRDQVALTVTTKDPSGKPVPSDVALSVVDDTVVSFADDKTGHLLSRVYLESELPGDVEEPNLFFDLAEEKSGLAMELLMGTRGWRAFEWAPVFSPPPPPMPKSDVTGGVARLTAFDGNLAVMEGDEGAARRGGAPDRRRAKGAAQLGGEGMGLRGGGLRLAAPAMQAAGAAAPPPRAPPPPPGAPPPAAARPATPPLPMAGAGRMAARPAAAEQKKDIARPQVLPQNFVGDVQRIDVAEADADVFVGNAFGILGAVVPMPEMPAQLAPVRVFPAPVYGGTAVPAVRSDFRETIHWAPTVKTGTDGTATVTFYLSDAVTSFRVFTEGTGGARAGRDEAVIESKLPFSMDVKLPLEVSAGDHITVPLTLTNEGEAAIDVDVKASFGTLVTVKSDVGGTKALQQKARDSMFYELDVSGVSGSSKVSFAAEGQGLKDEFTRELVVVPRGFPVEQSFSGTVKAKALHTVDVGGAVAGTVEASVRVYPSPTATLLAGLEGMLREPNGCFEQTSSTNYPNIMILTYLERNNIAAPEVQERAQRLLDSGYKKLVGFETSEKGYEWFGGAPGHEALSAYGLLEFIDMKGVYGDVDGTMVARTAAWLKGRRDGKGGYERNARALDSFGGASPDVTNAYITYALSEAKVAEIDTEVGAEEQRASSSSDAYVLALATNTLFNAGRPSAAEAAAKRLAAMQDADGAFTKAEMSITRSGGESLQLETTALAVMALLKSSVGYADQTRRAVEWMMSHRGSYGQWGATQSTVLSLKALLAWLDATRATQGPGSVIVTVNGKSAGSVSYEAGHKDPIVIDGLGQRMTAGKNDIKVLVDGQDALPYTLGVTYRSATPATSPDAVVDVSVSLDKTTAKMGEPVRANVVVKNKTAAGQPMTLARIGLPGGLAYQDWQLKKLRDDKVIAFYETRAREVILYFRDLKPSEQKQVPLDLVARVPGSYEGPASSAYLYYTAEHKAWAAPLRIDVTH